MNETKEQLRGENMNELVIDLETIPQQGLSKEILSIAEQKIVNKRYVCASNLEMLETDDFWKWLGGFVDGEGCFHIGVTECKTSLSSFKLRPSVSISQNSDFVSVLNIINKRIGYGKVCTKTRIPKVTCRPTSVLSLYNSSAVDFANKIKPYLIIKLETCEEFIKICDLISQKTHYTKEGFLEIIKRREALNTHKQNNYVKKIDFYRNVMPEFDKMKVPHRRWTKEECNIIKNNPDKSLSKIAEILERSYHSVFAKRKELKEA